MLHFYHTALFLLGNNCYMFNNTHYTNNVSRKKLQFSSRVYDSLTGLKVAYTLRYTAILRLSKNDNRIVHEFIDEMTTEYIRFDGTVG